MESVANCEPKNPRHGIRVVCGLQFQPGALGVLFQQALAFQAATYTLTDQLSQILQLALGWRFNALKAGWSDYPVEGGISISTRSIYNLLEILSAATDVPEQDLVAHRALSYPPLGLVGQKLRVRRDSVAPEDASTAVQYRDAWYYIDDTNQNTKLFFRLVTTLMSVSIADSTSSDAASLLTVPVSK